MLSEDEFIPSEWDGNYTCADDGKMIVFKMNITKSASVIGTTGDLLINNSSVSVVGTFGSFFKTFALQGQDKVVDEILRRNFTNVELNGKLITPLLIHGKIIFGQGNGTYLCDTELRRKAGNCHNYHL